MLETEKPNAVSLVVPVNLTAKLAVEIIQMEYPIIMEKPSGMNRSEALSIIEASKKYNVPTQVAFNRRYTSIINAYKKTIHETGTALQNIRCDFFRSIYRGFGAESGTTISQT